MINETQQELDFNNLLAAKEYLSAEDLPEVATVKEIASYLRVSPGLVYKMFNNGEIPGGYRVGRLIRFNSKVVIAWVLLRGGRRNHLDA